MSMALRSMANGLTSFVNSNIEAQVIISNCITEAPDGSMIPSYLPPITRTVQFQSMESNDLEKFGFAQQQGMYMFAYLDGMLGVINRDEQLATSLIKVNQYGSPRLGTWQVIKIAESYSDWVKVIIKFISSETA